MVKSCLVLILCLLFGNFYSDAKDTKEHGDKGIKVLVNKMIIHRSATIFPEIIVQNSGSDIIFSIDKSVGQVQVVIYDDTEKIVDKNIYEVFEENIYSLSIEDLSTDNYIIKFIMSDYSGLEYSGKFCVV